MHDDARRRDTLAMLNDKNGSSAYVNRSRCDPHTSKQPRPQCMSETEHDSEHDGADILNIPGGNFVEARIHDARCQKGTVEPNITRQGAAIPTVTVERTKTSWAAQSEKLQKPLSCRELADAINLPVCR